MKKLKLLVMPLMIISFSASCGSNKVSYTLTYTYNNETDDKYVETYDENRKTVKPTWAPEYSGYTFDGWFTEPGVEGTLFTFGDTLTANTIVFAHWTSAPTTYTVTFDAGPNGKFLNDKQKISFKLDRGTELLSYIRQLSTPTLEGHTFAYYEYEGKNNAIDYDDVVTSDLTLKANYFDSSTEPTNDLNNFDWKTIKNISVTGNPSQWFNIGATKKVNVNKKNHTVRIIGFNHDYSELPDDGSDLNPNKVVGITFEFANVITDSNGNAVTTKWNNNDDTRSTNYDYRESTLNDFLNNDVLDMLPSSDDPDNPDLREVIKPVDKKVGVYNDSNGTYTATSFDGETYPYPYLFPLAHDEMVNHEDYVTVDEGSIYGYYYFYSTQDHRIKRVVDGDGDHYWFRSPYTNILYYAWRVDQYGIIDGTNYIADDPFAVAPAFCV